MSSYVKSAIYLGYKPTIVFSMVRPFHKVFFSIRVSISDTTSKKVLVTQLCPTLCDTMDCSPPGSSVHRILQARILEWIAMPSSIGLSCLFFKGLSCPFCLGSHKTKSKCSRLHFNLKLQLGKNVLPSSSDH